jgi:hypothetical protein
MAGSHPEAQSSRLILREEAQKLLNEAIRMVEPAARKHLLARSFELVQRAEILPEPPMPEAPPTQG